MYIISGTYKDRGANEMDPIVAKNQIVLKSPLVEAESYDAAKQAVIFDFKDERKFVNDLYNDSHLQFNAIDLTGVDEIVFGFLFEDSGRSSDAIVELHAGSPTGELLGTVTVKQGQGGRPVMKVAKKGVADLYFVFKSENEENIKLKFHPLDWLYFKKEGITDKLLKSLN